MSELTKIETSIAFLEIKNDMLHAVFKQDADVTLESAMETVAARKEIQQGKKMLVLIDNRNVWQVTKDANTYSASKEVGEMSKAMAILSGTSVPVMLITNFFIKFNKLHSPTKMFKSKKKALSWLETFR